MTPNELFALFGTSSAAVVALLVFVLNSIWRAKRDAREVRRRLVARVLNTVDSVVKQSTRPLVLTMWNRNEIDLALVQTRLALDLEKRDAVISHWVWSQTQRILVAKTDSDVTRIAGDIAMRLAMWHNGAVSRKWFQLALLASPVDGDFTIPKRLRWRKTGKLIKESATLWGLLAGGVWIVKQVNS